MSIENVKAELSMAKANGWLTSIHMHGGQLIEYAEIMEFSDADQSPATVRIRTYNLLSGLRLIPKRKAYDIAVSHISYADLHQDKPAPIPE